MNPFENDYKFVCSSKDLRDGEGKRFMIEDVDVALFKLNGKIFALSNICPHQQSALIYDGFIENGFVICPVHGWMFNLNTGRTPAGTKGLDNYDVKVIDDNVYVKVFKRNLNW